jgi:two-component system chemotaxis response regulator CheY
MEDTVKALIVDDSRAMRMMLKKVLLAHGFETLFEAGNGREGIERLEESGPVDLVLVDWNMPVMDGLEFVSEVRKNQGYKDTRLMMVTTESEVTQMSRALDAGANEYVMKPFTPEGLREKLSILGLGASSA